MVKIFSSFDTELSKQIVAEKEARYWADKVLFVRRDPIYLFIKVYLPLLVWLAWSIILVLAWINLLPSDWSGRVVLRVLLWSIAIAWLIVWFIATRKSIDYTMDYTVITPEEVLQYDQEGVLNRVSRSMSVWKIKTIKVQTWWLLQSIFNFWAIIFFSEWDSSGSLWDIRLNYISSPNLLKDRIDTIVDVIPQDPLP